MEAYADHRTSVGRTDPLAIVALVTGILGLSLIAIICGAISLQRVKAEPGLQGRTMALWGLWLGIVWAVVSVLGFVAMVFLATSLG